MFWIILLFSLLAEVISETNKTRTETDLHMMLFDSYNPDVMPVKNKSDAIIISIELFLMNLDSIDEKKQTFTVRGFMENKWRNRHLTWNPSDFGEIKSINVQNKNIWLPDLALMNVYDSPTELGQRDGRTILDHNGVCVTWPYKVYQVGCKIHIRKFPFDVQTCELDFLSWTNPVSVLKLKTSEKLSFYYFKQSAEWALDSYEVIHYQNPYGFDFWDHVIFRFTFRRKWLFIVLNTIVPILCISCLNCVCFIIPADSGEKITLCISVFLTLVVF